MLGEPYEVPIEEAKGGHGGGDPILLNDIFGTPKEDKFKGLHLILMVPCQY